MSVIIRLQNLPWNASALDIRRFFHGLSIPDGGVHIIGGEKGDAFIAFSTDEDARQGMMLTGECLNDVPVKLFLSSKTEMQNVIASARTGPSINVAKPKDESFDHPPPQMSLGRKDDFRGPGFLENRGTGFSDMSGSRNLLPAPQQMFGGNTSFNREPGFSQSGSFGDQRSSNQGGFNNQTGSNHTGSNRPFMNSMGPLGQPGLNRPHGSDLFEPNLHGEGNQQGFNRSGGRFANDVNLTLPPPGRGQGPQMNQGKGLFDTPLLDAGARNGNMRPIDKPIGEMLDMPNRTFSSDQRDIGKIGGGGFRGNSDRLGLDRNLDLSFNRPVGPNQDVPPPRNFEPLNRFPQGDSNFERNERFNNNMNMDVDRPINRNFSEKPNPIGPNGENFGRGDERDMNNGRRDSLREWEPFGGFGRDQFGMIDQNKSGQSVGIRGVDNEMMDQRHGPGMGFRDSDDLRKRRDDLGPNEPGSFRNLKPFGGQELGRPFGGQEISRPFDKPDPGRELSTREPGRPFGGPAPIRPLMREAAENAPWSSEPMNEYDGGRPGRLDKMIPSLMSSKDNVLRPAFEVGGNRRDTRSDWCIHVFNLPTKAFNYREIRQLFKCVPREGLKIINDKFGERVGEAFMKFDSERSFTSSLSLNNQTVEGKKIRVEACTLLEYNDAVDDYRPSRLGAPPKSNPRSRSPISRKPLDLCILIRRMPPKVTVAEILRFLGHDLHIAPNGGPFLELAKDNRPIGNAVVELATERDFKDALSLDKKLLMGCQVYIIGITKDEFMEKSKVARREAAPNNKESTSERDKRDTRAKGSELKVSRESHPDDTCVQLAGLPWSTTNETIVEFFKGMKIVRDGIYIVRTPDGKPAGQGYVEFANASERKKALSKHKQFMGKRYVEVTPIAYKIMVEKIKAVKDRRGAGGEADTVIVLSEDEGDSKTKTEYIVRMQNLHTDTQLEDIMDFFRGLHPIIDSIKLQYKDGKPTGDGLVSFQSPREAERAISDFNRRSMLGRPVTLSAWPTKK